MTFPTTRLGIIVEAALGSTANMNPAAWPWVDLSSRLLAQGISIEQGQENESQGLQPATATIELDNLDGALTPNNAMSSYWPYIRRGTPVRITLEGGRKGAWLPGGTGNYWSSAHRSADNISGDIDIRVRLDPDRWSDPNPSDFTQYLAAIWGVGANTCSWTFGLTGPGQIEFAWSADGSTQLGLIWGSESLAALRPLWVGFTLDANNGAGGYSWNVYRSDADSPPADITTWDVVEFGSYDGIGTASMRTGTSSSLKIGTRSTGEPGMRGNVYNVQIRNGINGTVVANADFTAQTLGATSFNDSTGRTWTRAGSAAISTYRTRFAGTIDSVVLDWPYGNHNAPVEDDHPSECRAVITISDVVRRLGQGTKPLQSSLRRFLTANTGYDLMAYWPAEDQPGAIRLASGQAGGSSMTAYGLKGTDGSLVSSAPLPVMPSDGASGWIGAVPYEATDRWTVNFVYRAGEGPTGGPIMSLVNVGTNGAIQIWQIRLTSTVFGFIGWDRGGTAVVDVSEAFSAAWWGPWMLVHWDMIQDGADIDWAVTFTSLETGNNVTYTGTVAGQTLGQPNLIANNLLPGDAPKGLAFGHVVMTNGSRSNGWLAGPDTAWVGETAAHRLYRLCAEEGLQAEIVGDPELTSAAFPRGVLAFSQPMGYQAQDDLLTLLDACAAVDRGMLTSRQTHSGFVYRCRSTFDNQPVRLVLDATSNAVRIPLQPTLDDQRIRNDITVSATNGSSARVTDAASIAAEGLYQEEITVNGVGGVRIQDDILDAMPGLDVAVSYQNENLAGWLLSLGTQTDLRYPKILVDFSLAPSLMATWSELALGDRIQLTGLPNQHPSAAVELIVEYLGDLLSPTAWVGQLVGSPGAPYLVGVLDA